MHTRMNTPISRSTRNALGLLIAAGVATILYRLLRRGHNGSHPDGTRLPHGPVTQSVTPVRPADVDLGTPGQNTEQRLDEALLETFPGSDPISTRIE